MDIFVEVVIDNNNKNVDKLFTYTVPFEYQDSIEIGKRCIVPFGRGNIEIFALIVKIKSEIDFDEKKCKKIIRVIDKDAIISRELINLAYLMSKKYYCSFNECLKLSIPKKASLTAENVLIVNTENLKDKKIKEIEENIINYILENNNKVVFDEVLENFENSKNVIMGLKNKKIISFKNITEVKDLQQKFLFIYINYENENSDELIKEILKKKNKQSEVIDFLLENDDVVLKDLLNMLKITKSPVKSLLEKNIIKLEAVNILRNPEVIGEYKGNNVSSYTDEQQNAIDYIKNEIYSGVFTKPILLHGVTGSGKTEVYLNLVHEVINMGNEAIILVPEISLTGQLVNIFKSRFGDLVSLTHSRLSFGERYDQWVRAKNGEIKVIIGPRSALFTPFEHLGIIIIDEEHDSSFKSDVTPKYSAREVAIMRCEISNAQVVLGSATPKVETYYNAKNNEYHLIELKNRVNKKMPIVEIVDLRDELLNGNKSIFSSLLIEKIVDAISKDEQIILFLNKRGYASFINCRSCGEVIKCPNCDVTMTYHSHNEVLRCHYCNRVKQKPKNCPICGSKFIKHFGVGTQQVADEIQKLFPNEKIVRMDQDTTKGKNSHDVLIDAFRSKKARFLVGTQMISKGLDFNDVTVVGVIAGDMSLNINEYLGGELTFSLLTQVAGRAGRSEKQGNVIIQTYKPDNYAIIAAKDNDYLGFYENEIAYRKLSNNPPFCNNFYIYATSENEKNLIKTLYKLVDIMVQYKRMIFEKNSKNDLLLEIIGPAPQILSKVRRKYRWRILVKGNYINELMYLVTTSVDFLKETEECADINISLNLNPENIQ
ncbi:MAG: primosomal protein N' [Lachnospirales bacterium]